MSGLISLYGKKALKARGIEVCSECGGGGSIWPQDEPLLRICPTCNGTGHPSQHPAFRKVPQP